MGEFDGRRRLAFSGSHVGNGDGLQGVGLFHFADPLVLGPTMPIVLNI